MTFNIHSHLASYRDSVGSGYSKTFNVANFAKTIQIPDVTDLTAYDYLKTYMARAIHYADKEDLDGYKEALLNHQQSLLNVLSRKSLEGILPEAQTDPLVLLDLISERGYLWFKHYTTPFTITMKFKDLDATAEILFIPRYIKLWQPYWEGKRYTVIDADELNIITVNKLTRLGRKIYEFKKRLPAVKITGLNDIDFDYKEVSAINDHLVTDWTLPLF